MTADQKDKVYRDLGVKIMTERLNRGFSAPDVFKPLDIDASDYEQIEMGTRHIQIHTLVNIATLLNMSVGEFFDGSCSKPHGLWEAIKRFWRQLRERLS